MTSVSRVHEFCVTGLADKFFVLEDGDMGNVHRKNLLEKNFIGTVYFSTKHNTWDGLVVIDGKIGRSALCAAGAAEAAKMAALDAIYRKDSDHA